MSNTGLHIRQATLDDAETIADPHVRSWRAHYVDFAPADYLASMNAPAHARDYWRPLLADPAADCHAWIAEVAGEAAGFASTEASAEAGAWPVPTGCGWLHHIHLAPGHVGTGVGRVLFAHALDALREDGFSEGALWVYEANVRARRFYEAAGWEPDGGRNMRRLGNAEVPQLRYRGRLDGWEG